MSLFFYCKRNKTFLFIKFGPVESMCSVPSNQTLQRDPL